MRWRPTLFRAPLVVGPLLLCLAFSAAAARSLDPELQALGKDFFAWRALTQPATGDDIPRVERPKGWAPDYSPSAIERYRDQYTRFRKRLDNLGGFGWSVADSVDYLLLQSAIERVNWELSVLRLPHRNPDFYVQQTVGALFELLLLSSPVTAERVTEMILRLRSVPRTLEHARQNLTEPVGPFADIALAKLDGMGSKLARVNTALKALTTHARHAEMDSAFNAASAALEKFAQWLEMTRPEMSNLTSIGQKNYDYFLKNIALLPFTTGQLLLMGQMELNRTITFEAYEGERQARARPATLFKNARRQIARAAKDEQAVRIFLEKYNIMTVPGWLQHYHYRELPDHLAPLSFMGVNDDLTSPARLDEPAVRYINPPSPHLGFFQKSMAEDPRGIIVHEGIPGHYYQMARSWRNPDPIRRHFFDSGPNEGIGFYVEELLLQFGMFDDRPRTRQMIYRYMRLRALRVEVDIQLALGHFTVEQAGDYLAATVPMDQLTATHEAGFFAYNPGQAISYQIGKLQIQQFLADTRLAQGEKFDLRAFHDTLMINGNVPIALLRWEYLGLTDEVQRLW